MWATMKYGFGVTQTWPKAARSCSKIGMPYYDWLNVMAKINTHVKEDAIQPWQLRLLQLKAKRKYTKDIPHSSLSSSLFFDKKWQENIQDHSFVQNTMTFPLVSMAIWATTIAAIYSPVSGTESIERRNLQDGVPVYIDSSPWEYGKFKSCSVCMLKCWPLLARHALSQSHRPSP